MIHRILTIAVLAFTALLFAPSESLAQRTGAKPLAYQKRIELAKKLLGEVKTKAMKDNASRERLSFFTAPWSSIDPKWTANFIIENPPAGSSTTFYDHSAIMNLMTKSDQLDDQTILKLLRSPSGSNMMFYLYARKALKNATDDRIELRKNISELAFKSERPKIQGLDTLVGQLNLARELNDEKAIVSVSADIDKFFRSGAGKKSWRMIAKHRDENHQSHRYAMHMQQAPDDLAKELVPPKSKLDSVYFTNTTMLIQQMKGCQDKDRATVLRTEAKASLAKVKKILFGQAPYQQIMKAGMLGTIAKLDPKRALEFSKTTPTPHSKIWAQLVIAPELAKTDRDRAVEIIRACYQAAAKLTHSNELSNHDFPGMLIMTKGLTIVESIAPELMDECLELSFKAVEKNDTQSVNHFFVSVSILARYDLEKARRLFDEQSEEVDVSSAGDFFKALLVFEPDQVWDEYQQVPTDDKRNLNYQIYVRNVIIGALLAPDDEAFWNQLTGSGFLTIPVE